MNEISIRRSNIQPIIKEDEKFIKKNKRFSEFNDASKIIDENIERFSRETGTSIDKEGMKENILSKFRNWHSINLLLLIVAIIFKNDFNKFDNNGVCIVINKDSYKNYKQKIMKALSMDPDKTRDSELYDQEVYCYMNLAYRSLD